MRYPRSFLMSPRMCAASSVLASLLHLYGSPASSQAVQEQTTTIEYIAHASFIVESPGGTRILVDPYADRVWLGYDFPRGLDYEAVVITHPHYDHDGGEYRGLDVPWPTGTAVYRDPGMSQVGDVRLTGIAAKHADPYGMEFGQKNVVWVLEVGGLRIAHLGDNGPLDPEVVGAMGQVDVLMVPIDGEEHILTYEAVERIIDEVSPGVVVPMHYRLVELEPGDGPSDLGPIDPWLRGRPGVRRLRSHTWRIAGRNSLADARVVVFDPSPEVPRARQAFPGITMAWTEAPLGDVLRAFAVYSGRSIVAGSGVDGVFVTADIRDQPWDVALQTILVSRGLTAVEDEYGIIRVDSYENLHDRDAVEPLVTRTYRVSYSRATELQTTISPLLTERGSVSAVESANALVVTDVARVHRVVARLLGR